MDGYDLYFLLVLLFFAAVGSTLISTTDFDVMTRASFLDRVITMQLESKYRRNLDFCQSVIARKSP
jgi:hypothetical protein